MDEKCRTCLHYAVRGGSVPVVRYLVDQCGFDLGLRTAVSYGVVYTYVHDTVYALMHGWTGCLLLFRLDRITLQRSCIHVYTHAVTPTQMHTLACA